MIADELGNPIDGIPAGLDHDTVKEMSNKAKSICSGSGLDISDFGKNLGLFDALLALAAEMGLTQLLKNLANCLNYFDFNGEDVLSEKFPTSIANGDYKTADTIVDLIGKDRIKDPVGSVKELISKIPGNEEEPLPYVQHLMDNASVSNEDIYTSPVDNYGFECDEELTAITVTNSSDFSSNDNIKQGILGDEAELIGSNPFSEPEELAEDTTSFSNQMW
jgi:flagellin-like hook-associated protein FlgL